MAGVLAARGASALVFRGDDGLDELTTSTTSAVWCVDSGSVTASSVDPATLGITAPAPGALRGADASYNADVARRLLRGEQGPVRDAVLLNAAAALVAHDKQTSDLERSLRANLDRAAGAIDNGSAADLLDRWTLLSQELSAGR
jgi:anthranilate phosphoribosyltransferase